MKELHPLDFINKVELKKRKYRPSHYKINQELQKLEKARISGYNQAVDDLNNLKKQLLQEYRNSFSNKGIGTEMITIQGKGLIKYYIMKGNDQAAAFVEFLNIYVYPEYRNKGYGSKLIKLLAQEAKRRNISCIYVKVSKHNQLFKNFLKKNGFFHYNKKELWIKKIWSISVLAHSAKNIVTNKLSPK
jgi:GNAT superfamily N-acetyltransferase